MDFSPSVLNVPSRQQRYLKFDRWKNHYLVALAKRHSLLFGLALAGGIFTLAVIGCLLLILLVGIANRNAPNSRVIVEADVATQPPPDLVRDSTMENWKSIHSIVASAFVKVHPLEVSEQYQRKAAELRNLSTINVDLEAVDFALDTAVFLDRCASDSDPARLSQLFVEGLARGLMGDPSGPVVEQRRQVSIRQQEWANLRDRKQRVRARLTAKFGVQFQ